MFILGLPYRESGATVAWFRLHVKVRQSPLRLRQVLKVLFFVYRNVLGDVQRTFFWKKGLFDTPPYLLISSVVDKDVNYQQETETNEIYIPFCRSSHTYKHTLFLSALIGGMVRGLIGGFNEVKIIIFKLDDNCLLKIPSHGWI